MHDLMHDLAQYVSEGEYFRIESGEQKEIPAHTRHIFVVDHMLAEYVEKMSKLKDLCAIFVSSSYLNVSLKEVDFDALFMKLRKLYIVHIEDVVVNIVPKSVVHLKNLRYFNFETFKEDANFKSLNRLYQLHVLYTRSQIPDVGRLPCITPMFENISR